MPLISDSIGRVLGNRYRLVSALGSGASAHVFLAEDVSLQRRVAVKVLQPALAADQAFLKRFRAEARSAASLNHPHVLRVFDWGEDADGPYLVLEYLHGGSLRDVLDRGFRLSAAQSAQLGAQVAQGLAYAHARGLVHRDIKPANLLFDEEGRVRIADFGVARALAEAAWTEPAGAMVGTARYASPEQAQAHRVDGRSDVYSLALVLYECLTGEVPFAADTTVGTLMARVGATLPQHPALGALDGVLAKAAAPEPGDRFDAAEMAARLEAVGASLAPPAPLPLQVDAAAALTAPFTVGPDGAQGTPADALGGPPTLGALDPSATAMVGAGGVFDVEAIRGATPAGPKARARRHRRWPWLVVLLALVVAAGALTAWKEKLFTPSHPVPALTGRTVAAARAALAKDHFVLKVAAARHSVSVPLGDVVSQSPAARSSLKQGSTVRVVPSAGPPLVAVPSLAGLDCTGADRVLALAHLKAACPQLSAYDDTLPAGQVINWSYDGRLDPSSAPYGSTILVAVSKGHAPVTIPNLANYSYASAAQALKQLGLTPSENGQNSVSVPAGEVISTSPPAGQQAAYGSTVVVDVSAGPPTAPVPDVSGDTVSQATATLQAAGFSVAQYYGPSKGHVFDQVPSPGTVEPEGTAVTLYTM